MILTFRLFKEAVQMSVRAHFSSAVAKKLHFESLSPNSDFEPDQKQGSSIGKSSSPHQNFIKSLHPAPDFAPWKAIFSYAFDTLHFSHVVLSKNFEIVEFSNKRWTLEGATVCDYFLDDNDRSLANGLGTFKHVNMDILKRMIECTTLKVRPLEHDCIVTEQFIPSYEDKTKKIKDLAQFNIVRGILYETMLNRRQADISESEAPNIDPCVDRSAVIYEVGRMALNKFFGMKILSARRERFLLDAEKSRDLLCGQNLKLPESLLSQFSPEINSQTLIASLLRAVALAKCWQALAPSISVGEIPSLNL